MIIEFKRIPQPCFPPVNHWQYTVNGEALGYYTTDELLVLRDAALSDLKQSEGWIPEGILQDVRDMLAAINKALEEVAA